MRRLFTAAIALLALAGPAMAESSLLNVSYDPTRELYAAVNKAFAAQWAAQTGEQLTIRSSHGGSGAQARSVIDGLEADVVTLALQSDIDAIADHSGLLAADWQTKLPNHSVPYTSRILLVVRKGNPKAIHDWADLVKPGVAVITPNPKTSGGARWNYLAAWGYALRANNGDEAKARDFVGKLYHNVTVLDSGARGSTITFAQRHQGDVLIAWEDDALLAVQQSGADRLEIIVPSVTIQAEPVVAVVDKVVDRRGTRKQAEAYLQFLYSKEGQEIIAANHYRPINPEVAASTASAFPNVPTFTVDGEFGGWRATSAKHFADGGVFDQIYQPGQ
jgi:sulfate transport system substrate-binding protein